jgi:hypothetical protein
VVERVQIDDELLLRSDVGGFDLTAAVQAAAGTLHRGREQEQWRQVSAWSRESLQHEKRSLRHVNSPP